MEIFPAIDLYEGQVVRLLKGDYDKKTVYSADPVAVAETFKRAGAANIHLVDLEGARDGGTPNFEGIARIVRETGLRAEVAAGYAARRPWKNISLRVYSASFSAPLRSATGRFSARC